MLILQTERLSLRWFTADDAEFVVELVTDPDWQRFISQPDVRDVPTAQAWIEQRLTSAYQKQGFGLWAVERRTDTTLVGMCGLVDRDRLPDIDLGYALLPRFRGHGYVHEAATAVLHHATTTLGHPRVLAITDPTNKDSLRVLDSLNMKFSHLTTLPTESKESLIYTWTP